MLPEEYKNKVLKEDVLNILKELPSDSVDMVYSDPDYNVGIKYHGAGFTTTWDEYIRWYIEVVKESMRVLKQDGNMFCFNYPKQNAYLRVMYLDKVAYDVYDYVWVYPTNIGHSTRKFTTAHRSILHAVKSKKNKFYKHQVALPYKNPNDARVKKLIEKGSAGRMPYSWIEENLVKNVSKQKANHPCQIPEKVSRLLIEASTQPGDDVFILFGGSGSEVSVANKLGRNYLSCELSQYYYDMIISRIENEGKIEEVFNNPAKK